MLSSITFANGGINQTAHFSQYGWPCLRTLSLYVTSNSHDGLMHIRQALQALAFLYALGRDEHKRTCDSHCESDTVALHVRKTCYQEGIIVVNTGTEQQL